MFSFCNSGEDPGSLFHEGGLNTGFTHMAAAILAMHHFNDRNATVVPELANELLWLVEEECDVRLDLQTSRVYDTQSITHQSARDLQDAVVMEQQIPCGIVGGWTNLPAVDLSVLAHSLQIPYIAHRSQNARLSSAHHSPYTSMVYPELYQEVVVAVEYLRFIQRSNFIGLLYAQTESSIQKREVWGLVLNQYNMTAWTSAGYMAQQFDQQDVQEQVHVALQRIQTIGYRTIVVMAENPRHEIPLIAKAANDLQMNAGNYLWFFFDMSDGSFFTGQQPNDVLALLSGGLTTMPTSNAYINPQQDPFSNAFTPSNLATIADDLQRFNPIPPGQPGYVDVQAQVVMANRADPDFGATFMYDAVMAMGIGACLARRQQKKDSTSTATDVNINITTGQQHLTGIQQVEFTGAEGLLKFWSTSDPTARGSRQPGTIQWGVWNIPPVERWNTTSRDEEVPDDAADWVTPTALYTIQDGAWKSIATNIYRDGRTVPPDLLRDLPDQNYLPKSIRIAGLTMMGIGICLSISMALWVFVKKNTRVIQASQPFFLYLICLGCAIECASVWIISFDENSGWTETRLDRACATAPWFYIVGHILIYGSLSTKLWRVHQVLQFTRREIKIQQVMWPMALLLAASLSILLIWTLVDPLHWNREETDSITGESFGSCQSDSTKTFAPVEFLLVIPPTLLTAWMAWKTKDVDQMYAESWWIFIMVVVQLEIAMIAIPVTIILHDVSTEGSYLLICAMLIGFPVSTLSFILGPKVFAQIAEERGIDNGRVSARGSTQGVRISGIPTTPTAIQQVQAQSLANMTNSPGTSNSFSHSGNGSRRDASSKSALSSANSEGKLGAVQEEEVPPSPNTSAVNNEPIEKGTHPTAISADE